MVHQGFAEVNGTRLYYEVAGTGTPVLLIHGFTFDARMWDQQFEALAEHYQVIRFDLRGFGRSAVPHGEPYTFPADIKALLDFLGIDRAVVAGLSLGAGVAVDFALGHPQMVRALVLASPTLGGFPWSGETGGHWEEVRAVAQLGDVDDARAAWLDGPLFRSAQRSAEVTARLREMVEGYSGWHWLNDDTHEPYDPPAIERLDEIAATTLVLVGEHDVPDFHYVTEILTNGVRNARWAVVPDAGHMANMEAPEAFNRALLDFLRSELDRTE